HVPLSVTEADCKYEKFKCQSMKKKGTPDKFLFWSGEPVVTDWHDDRYWQQLGIDWKDGIPGETDNLEKAKPPRESCTWGDSKQATKNENTGPARVEEKSPESPKYEAISYMWGSD